jgi:hypothetical protein
LEFNLECAGYVNVSKDKWKSLGKKREVMGGVRREGLFGYKRLKDG